MQINQQVEIQVALYRNEKELKAWREEYPDRLGWREGRAIWHRDYTHTDMKAKVFWRYL